mmetsp:Transcript_54748/g.123268  ORF Transcript_54748/g.123268 Transcript_54748/m.123268 type:complete len:226 (-) Transcript_54748:23-700(-)
MVGQRPWANRMLHEVVLVAGVSLKRGAFVLAGIRVVLHARLYRMPGEVSVIDGLASLARLSAPGRLHGGEGLARFQRVLHEVVRVGRGAVELGLFRELPRLPLVRLGLQRVRDIVGHLGRDVRRPGRAPGLRFDNDHVAVLDAVDVGGVVEDGVAPVVHLRVLAPIAPAKVAARVALQLRQVPWHRHRDPLRCLALEDHIASAAVPAQRHGCCVSARRPRDLWHH